MNVINIKNKMIKFLSEQIDTDRGALSPFEKFMKEHFEWVVDEEGDIGVMLFGEFVIGSYKCSDTFILYHIGDNDVPKFRPTKKIECNLNNNPNWTFED